MLLRLRKNLTNKKRSQFSERDTAKFFKGKLQPGSGALPVARFKADVKSEKFLIDDKVTNAQSFGIKISFWRKLANEAWTLDKRPILRISFTQGSNLYVMDEQTLHELLNPAK